MPTGFTGGTIMEIGVDHMHRKIKWAKTDRICGRDRRQMKQDLNYKANKCERR